MSWKKYFIIIFLVFCIVSQICSFRIYWHAPFKRCLEKYNISIDFNKYGLIVNNDNDGWLGGNITIFYQSELGLFPFILPNGTLKNGGIPQLADIQAHLQKTAEDIKSFIPDENFSGIAVIDYESWRPIWDRDYDSLDIYRETSKDLVRREHPEWTDEQITAEAKEEFEQAARIFLSKTISLGKSLRPHGIWGYYGFPRCYNYKGLPTCSNETIAENNQLSWLFNISTVILPSAYLPNTDSTFDKNFVHGQVIEALRCHTDQPVMVYVRPRYHSTTKWLSKENFIISVKDSWELGSDGVILWDDHELDESLQSCMDLKTHLEDIIGPVSLDVLTMASQCSQQLCNNHGKCVKQTSLVLGESYDKLSDTNSNNNVNNNIQNLNNDDRKLFYDPVLRYKKEVINSKIDINKKQNILELILRNGKDIRFKNRISMHQGERSLKEAVNVSKWSEYHCECYKGWHGKNCDVQNSSF